MRHAWAKQEVNGTQAFQMARHLESPRNLQSCWQHRAAYTRRFKMLGEPCICLRQLTRRRYKWSNGLVSEILQSSLVCLKLIHWSGDSLVAKQGMLLRTTSKAFTNWLDTFGKALKKLLSLRIAEHKIWPWGCSRMVTLLKHRERVDGLENLMVTLKTSEYTVSLQRICMLKFAYAQKSHCWLTGTNGRKETQLHAFELFIWIHLRKLLRMSLLSLGLLMICFPGEREPEKWREVWAPHPRKNAFYEGKVEMPHVERVVSPLRQMHPCDCLAREGKSNTKKIWAGNAWDFPGSKRQSFCDLKRWDTLDELKNRPKEPTMLQGSKPKVFKKENKSNPMAKPQKKPSTIHPNAQTSSFVPPSQSTKHFLRSYFCWFHVASQ